MSPTDDEAVVAATRTWIEKAVIGLELCPFAKAVYVKQQVRYAVSAARDAPALLADLKRELLGLAQSDADAVDTALLIHPQVLVDFLDYNDFLAVADAALAELGLSGILQIASFHPAYRFAATELDDVSNFTNRSPYPMLHLLREASVSRAVDAFPEAAQIYEKNIATLRRLGVAGWQALGLATAETPGNPAPPRARAAPRR
jgi:hypothetical protein